MARKTLDEAQGTAGGGAGRVAVAGSTGLRELAFLRWGDWEVRDGALCLGSTGNPGDGFRIPLRRVGEQHWLAHFVGRGASAHDVACLALALRDLRRRAGEG
jgi:hypothetical protein